MNVLFGAAVSALLTKYAAAQVTPAAGYTPPDDTPSTKIGATIFADYTVQREPETKDADGNDIKLSSFNIGRAYLNVTGNLNHIFAYRITPDITRESGTGSSLNGSYTFRLKYAYGQINLDDWTTKGSWIRFGMNQTPYMDYTEGIYRYRFQGPIFVDREGFLVASDVGVSGHYNFPSNFGDVHVGVYNGEGYSKSETNNQKALQARVSVRPFPMGGLVTKGLRFTAFADADHYVEDAKKSRFVGQASWESKWANAAIEYLKATDQTSATKPEVDARGWSAWVTPKFPHGYEALLRRDSLEPNTDNDSKKTRTIVGVSKWFTFDKIATAVMLDGENVNYSDFSPARADEKRYAVHMLVNF